MTTLTGNLADVTNKAPENISSITVKAPAARIGGSGGSSVIVTSPATVNFNSSTGDITISNLTGGLSWLYIEGDGWADSIGLAVADGMVTLVEAVANALGMPGIVDYIRLLADLEGRIEDVAQGAVDAAAENIKWTKRDLATGEDLDTVITPGLYKVINYIRAVSLVNRPEESNAIDRASLEVQTAGGGVQQTWYPMGVASRTDMPVMRRRRDTAGTWTEWERINAFTPAKESYIMQSISAAKWEKRALVRDENLNDITTAGLYYAPSYTVANSLVNNPVELSRSAIDRAKIDVSVTGSYISQIWTTIPSATKAAETVERHRDSTGAWSEWSVYGGGARDEDEPATSFETLGLASHGMEGEHVGTRSLLQALSGEESPVWSWWAPTPDEPLEIPTHDGGGQTCHPSVLYFPNTWGGWKYWMAHTPYPNFQEAHEDPNIAVSDDGVNWQVPNGVTNPLDDGAGRPNYHNSDTHLAMWGNTMVLTWRTVDRPNGGQNIIYARTSQNGVTWTPKVEMLKVPLGSAESTFVSQSLVKMPTGWRLYGIRSNYGPNRLGYYETSVETLPTTSDWGAAQNCDIGTVQTGRDPWHSEVQRLSADDWVAVISDGKRGSTGVDGDIYLARSTDGVTWDVSPMPLTPRNNGVINSLYKTGFVVSGTGTNRVFDLWVSGYRSTSRTWAVYRTRAEYVNSHAGSRILDLLDDVESITAERTRYIPRDANWDTLTAPGPWMKDKTWTTDSNRPPTTTFDGCPGVLWVYNTGNTTATIVVQVFYGYAKGAVNEGIWYRASSTNGVFAQWQRLADQVELDALLARVDALETAEGSEPQVEWAASNQALMTQFVYEYGGAIPTGEKGAVAFRFDHGMKNFAEKILPATKAAGIKVSQAYNPRNWSRTENAGYTATNLNQWVADGDVEIWNHGASHIDATNYDALYDEIVTGKAEIEAELPAAAGHVWGFAVPGVGANGYNGFSGGTTPEGWDTLAGRLILKHHAVSTGSMYGTAHRILDGTPRQGLRHYTMDTATVATLKAQIDTAISTKTGLQLMLHPSAVDSTGSITSAQFQEVIDYVVSKRDAGELVTLSPYEMMLADSRR